MRTTINIEDGAFAVAQAYAQVRALKLGQAISDLTRKGGAGRQWGGPRTNVMGPCRLGNGQLLATEPERERHLHRP